MSVTLRQSPYGTVNWIHVKRYCIEQVLYNIQRHSSMILKHVANVAKINVKDDIRNHLLCHIADIPLHGEELCVCVCTCC